MSDPAGRVCGSLQPHVLPTIAVQPPAICSSPGHLGDAHALDPTLHPINGIRPGMATSTPSGPSAPSGPFGVLMPCRGVAQDAAVEAIAAAPAIAAYC